MKCLIRLALLFFVLQILAIHAAYAAPGSLDTGFNGSGAVVFDGLADARDAGRAVAVQADGKIVAAGYANNGDNKDILVARYNEDGSLDATFGTAGSVTYDGGDDDYAYAVGLQSDGKIIVGGYRFNGANNEIILIRYTTTGVIDPGFGNNGIVIYKRDGQSSITCKSLVVASDDKIVVAGGTIDQSGHEDAVVLRFKADGTLDDTFGLNASGAVYFNNLDDQSAYAVALAPGGKIVVTGITIPASGGNINVLLFRLDAAGNLDATFGTNGFVNYGGAFDANPTGIAVEAGGKIYVAGYAYNGNDDDIFLLGFDSNGALDGNFGVGGVRIYDSGHEDIARALAVQGDGKILVAGSQDNGTDYDIIIMRVLADGTDDGTFGSAGIWSYNSGFSDEANALALDGTGKIIVTGSVQDGASHNLLVARSTSGGSADNTFNAGGVALLNTASSTVDHGYAVAVQPDGKILAAGAMMGNVVLLRYTAPGVLDPTFGDGGVATYDSGGEDIAYAIAIQDDGKILVTGTANQDLLLLRFNPDGTPDIDFGDDGVVIYDAGGNDVGYALAVQPDGKILVAGAGVVYGASDLILMRFHDDGTLDASFGDVLLGATGITTYDHGGHDNSGNSVFLLPDGKILVGGYSAGRMLLLQYLDDGTLDSSFGTAGVVWPDFGQSIYGGYATRDSDGKIVMAGYSMNLTTSNNDLVVSRFDGSGTLDPTFGTAGVMVFGGAASYVTGGTMTQSDGKPIVTGRTTDITNQKQLFVLRLDGSGSVDTTFGTNGQFTYSTGSSNSGKGLALQKDGRILVIGSTTSTNNDVLLLRLQGGIFPLSVSKSGSGSVTSDDGAINCGGDCSENYEVIKQVVLTAAPAAGYSLASWHGCDSTNGSQCNVLTSRAKAVTVSFTEEIPPTLVVSAPAAGIFTKNQTVTVSGTASDNAGIQSLTINGNGATVNGDSSFSYQLALSPGINTITVRATDIFGNISTDTRTVTYDSAAPLLAVTAPVADLITDQQVYVIKGTASDIASGVSVSVSFDGQTYTPAVVNGAFEQSVTLTAETTYPITVTLTDQAGNTATAQRKITYAKIGDIDGIPGVGLNDALLVLRFALGLATPTPTELARCDMAPLVNGSPQPDGKIDIRDVMLILRKAVGIEW